MVISIGTQVGVAVALLASAVLAAPEEKSDLPITVLDIQLLHSGTGEPIKELRQADFEVLEDGVPQDITLFRHDDVPLELVLLVHVGFWVSQSSRTALDQLRHEDRVAVMSLSENGKSRVHLGFSNDPAAIFDALGEATRKGAGGRGFGPAPWPRRKSIGICEAVLAASRLYDADPVCLRRRAILITTDDRDSPSGLLEAELANQLLGLDVALSGAILGPVRNDWRIPGPAPPLPTRSPAPEDLPSPQCQATPVSETTGGDLVKHKERWPPDNLLGELLDRVRSRYLIGYTKNIKADGNPGEIIVRLAGAAAKTYRDPVIRVRVGHCRGN